MKYTRPIDKTTAVQNKFAVRHKIFENAIANVPEIH